MTGPPTNSATVNCHPISSARITPSSTTRLVDATSKTIAVAKLAPVRNSARRQCHGRIGTRRRCRPEAGGDNQRARPIVTQPLLDRGSPHDGLHDSRQCEPQDQRPQNLPCHGTADGQSMADGVQPPHAASQRRMAMGTGYRSIGAGGRPSPLGPDKSKLSIRIRATPLAGFGRVHGQASATRSRRRRFWLA